MEFWEFLIQQEGDRSWLPLESPSVEILEGRYRVVARSNRASIATEIRVTHYATHETPPVRRVRKRSSQTNPDGLIVIMPFTRLQPGLWELRCTSDLMAEMMGESWQYVVQLDVVPEATSAGEDWAPDWPEHHVAAAEQDRMGAGTPPATTLGPAQTEGHEPLVGMGLDRVEAPPAAVTEIASPTEYDPNDPTVDSIPELDGEPAAREGVALEAEPEIAHTEIAHTEIADTNKPLANEPLIEEDGSSDVLEMLQQVEQRSEELVNAAFRDLGELSLTPAAGSRSVGSSDSSDSRSTESLASTGAEQVFPPLQVILERETFIIQRGESLVLTGGVECPADQPRENQPRENQPVISELRVRLYDPQTSQLLMDEVYPIDNRTPPFPFSGTISLPEHYQTYLVLGELIFQGTTPAGTRQVLATRSFNVTTDLHELIESIANDFPDGDALPPEALTPEISDPLPKAELNRLNAQLQTFQRSSQQPLPPQLRPPNPTRTHASLDLPSFAPTRSEPDELPTTGIAETSITSLPLAAASATPASSPLEREESVSTSAADLLLEQPEAAALTQSTKAASDQLDHQLDHQLEPLVSSVEANSVEANSVEANSVEANGVEANGVETGSPEEMEESEHLFLEWDDSGHRVPIWQQRRPRPVDLSDAPEDVSFRALNLQSRFWTRLQALATHPELSAMQNPLRQAGQANPAVVSSSDLARQEAIGLDASLAAQEIVVEDDRAVVMSGHDEGGEEAPEPLPGPVLPDDEPIPTPRLQLPSGELTAGQPIAITIKMPSLLARVYVKLWLRDRQTRSLVGTPRWVIDFVPDGFGNQMARTEVIVPPGCLKVQFEAIAVEIATQRESDKVTLTRPIVPPDLSPLSLDGLEI